MQLTRLTIAAIRAAYPEPRQANVEPSPGHSRAYCVGGAFYLTWLGYPPDRPDELGRGFPNKTTLARLFLSVIPALTAEQADGYAITIIELSDAGRFEEAWDVLGEMLEWQTAEGG